MLLSNDYYERIIYEKFVKELVKDIKNFVLKRLRQKTFYQSQRENYRSFCFQFDIILM